MIDPVFLIALAGVSFVLAGTLKGIVGIGLPTAALGIMTLVIDPRTAISLILFPMLATNAWQMVAAGGLWNTVKTYWMFGVVLLVGVSITAMATGDVGDQFLLGALGVVLLFFVWFTWAGWIPPISPKRDKAAQVFFGVFAGIIGGLTASWAAAIAMYLTMRNADKNEFIRVTGFLIFVGSIPLCVAYYRLGFFTGPLALSSAAMLVPAFAGMWIGGQFRHRLSGDAFRNTVLAVFVLLAVNLLRRALF